MVTFMTVKHCDGRVAAAAANLVLIRLFDCVPRTCSTARFQEVHSYNTGVSPPTFLSFLEFRNQKAKSGAAPAPTTLMRSWRALPTAALSLAWLWDSECHFKLQVSECA